LGGGETAWNGTDWVNCHPICVLFTDKMADLAGSNGNVHRAYAACVRSKELMIMSDTCWFEIEFRREDLPKFTKVLEKYVWDGCWWDEDQSEPEDKTIVAVVYDANYGWYDELQSLAAEDLSFTVRHDSGGAYGPCVYACYKGDMVECNSDQEGNPCVPVYRDGIDEVALEQCRKYWELGKKIKEEAEIT